MCRPSLEQPTSGLLSDSASAEEARIRNAYAKRQKDDARYSWFNPGHLLMIQDRERQLLALLCRYGLAPLTSKKILEIGCEQDTGFANLSNGEPNQRTSQGLICFKTDSQKRDICVLLPLTCIVEMPTILNLRTRRSIWSFSPRSLPRF